MKLGPRYWVAGVCAVLAMLVAIEVKHQAREDADALAKQLRLARAKGIPTTPAEFVATIPTASASENAAPYYRQLKGKVRDSGDPVRLGLNLLFHPTAKSRSEAQAYLDLHEEALKLVDVATRLPHCWFDRDWSSPAVTTTPEATNILCAARIVCLRASMAAYKGDGDDALADVKRLFVMAGHLAEGRTSWEGQLSDSIYDLGLQQLVYWRFAYPANQAYRGAFERLLLTAPRPDLKRDHSEALVVDFSITELFQSAAGRVKLGLKPGDENYGMVLVNHFRSQSKARVEIVKAEREYWAALDKPTHERLPLEAAASYHRDQALSTFATITMPSERLGDGIDREAAWEARRLQYMALLRALNGPKLAKAIKTSDLLSPFDDTPLQYSFDGKQIAIKVSGYLGMALDSHEQITLKIPPDEAIKP